MTSPTVLIADIDSSTLDLLPRILLEGIPQIAIETCRSSEELTRKLTRASYDMPQVKFRQDLHPSWTGAHDLDYTRSMAIKRLDHVSVVVDDLAAATDFSLRWT